MTDWVRLWHDMPTDPKWRVIARKSGQPLACVIALFTLLLTTASASDDRGSITNLSIEDAAAALDMDDADVAAIYSAMELRVIADGRLSGWERRQPKRERENDDSSERVKRHRAAVKDAVADDVTASNAMKRHETPRVDKIREDTDKKKNNNYAFSGRVIRVTEIDMARWRKAYPSLEIPALLQSRDDWLVDQPEPERKRWFNSTSNWLSSRQQQASTAAIQAAEPVRPVC